MDNPAKRPRNQVQEEFTDILCLFSICSDVRSKVITHEPLNRFASDFDFGTTSVLCVVKNSKLIGLTF